MHSGDYLIMLQLITMDLHMAAFDRFYSIILSVQVVVTWIRIKFEEGLSTNVETSGIVSLLLRP